MAFSSRQRIHVPAQVIFRELSGEAVLLNLESETYFGLDETGTMMWQKLTESASTQAAYDHLLAIYDVEPAVLQADMSKLISELVAAGLLELVDV